ncbi:unnamed protein product [Parnassius mnemosyne]|uniref:FP protein C-terminal domain-containing protein n=1 Tax=Parnassius mnemosyne TaxID=213953 RepID=A0AAV1L615_9NEOP
MIFLAYTIRTTITNRVKSLVLLRQNLSVEKVVDCVLSHIRKDSTPRKPYNSNPDINKSGEPSNMTTRKHKHDNDFSEALNNFTSEIRRTLRDWKKEIQDEISGIKNNLDFVLKTDLEKLNASFAEIMSELSSVRQEYHEIKKSVISLDLKYNETMKQITVLENSVQFNCDQYDHVQKKMELLSVNKKAIESLESKMDLLTNENRLLQLEINTNNQRDRLLNLEIVGVPEIKDEDLTNLIISIAKQSNVTISPNDILEVNRVTPKIKQQGRPKNIIAKLKSRLLKDNIISGTRKNRLTTKDLAIHGSVRPVYVNEHLTQFNKLLLKKCRETAKLKQYQYIWTKNGRIYVRKNDTSPALHISQERDVLKLI